jgi:molecular chaperone GrpE
MASDDRKPHDWDDSRRDLLGEGIDDGEVHESGIESGEQAPAGGQGPGAGGAQRLERERDELKDRLLRTMAEFDNYRKRVDRERRDREAEAGRELLEELLPLVDNFERALKAESLARNDPFRAGVELIYRQLVELLRKRGVVPIEAAGQDFDPHLHQAVEHVSSPDHRDGEVIDELRRGYLLGERLLRPAMVRVAKA